MLKKFDFIFALTKYLKEPSMSLPPVPFYYQCPASSEVIVRHYRPTGVPPRFVRCKCGHIHAKLIFNNPLQKISHQKSTIRKAGYALEAAGKALEEEKLKDPLIASNIRKAGEALKELP